MELHKGECVFCKNSNVVYIKNLQDTWTAMSTVFKSFVKNEKELQRLRGELELCPACVYVISLLGNNCRLIERNSKKTASIKNCFLCGTSSKDYKISDDLKEIINDIETFKNVNKPKMIRLCGGCFYFINFSKTYSKTLLKKYSFLSIADKKNSPRRTVPPKLSNSSTKVSKPNPKRKKDLQNLTLNHLRTVKESSYKVGRNVKYDKKLFTSLVYVNLIRIGEKPKSITPVNSPSRSRSSKKRTTEPQPLLHSEKIKKIVKPSFKIKLKKDVIKASPAIKKVVKKKKSQSDLLKVGRTLKVNIVRGTPFKTKAAVKIIEPLPDEKTSPRKSVTFADEKNVEFEQTELSPSPLNLNTDFTNEKSPTSKSILKNRIDVSIDAPDSSDDEVISPRTLKRKKLDSHKIISIESSDSESVETEERAKGVLTKKVNGETEPRPDPDDEIYDLDNMDVISDTEENILEKINDTLETNAKESHDTTSNDNMVNNEEIVEMLEGNEEKDADKEKASLNKSASDELFDKLAASVTPIKKYKPRPRSKQKSHKQNVSVTIDEMDKSTDQTKADDADISSKHGESNEEKPKDINTETAELSDDVEDELHLTVHAEDSSEEMAQQGTNSKMNGTDKSAEEEQMVTESPPSDDKDNEELSELDNQASNVTATETSTGNDLEIIEIESELNKDVSNTLNLSSTSNDTSFMDASLGSFLEKSSKSNKSSPKKHKPRPLSKQKKYEGGQAESNDTLTENDDVNMVGDKEKSDAEAIVPSIAEQTSQEDKPESGKKNKMVIPEDVVQSLVSKYVTSEKTSESDKSVNEKSGDKLDDSFVTQTMTELYADL